jgi:copper homeostasis protein (lipoprotein)
VSRTAILAILVALLPSLSAAADSPVGALPRSFIGTLPAASGPGIDWQLDLLADGSFQLRRRYLERAPDNVFDTIGRWVVGSDDASLMLAGKDETIAFAIESSERLRLLDQQARPIESALDYGIERAAVPLLEPELRTRGLYRYMADAALFAECLTGRLLPVAFTEDNLALERAYLALQESTGLVPGGEVLAELEARIAQLPAMEGDGLTAQLEPVRFIALHPDERCPEPFTQATLDGSDWLLQALDGTPITLAADQRRPYLSFLEDASRLAGLGGCNRLAGGIEVDGTAMRFGPTASTMMACPAGMELESALSAALEATESYRILGRHLDLYDGEGMPLARFAAGKADVP